jgi:hypothetical protein
VNPKRYVLSAGRGRSGTNRLHPGGCLSSLIHRWCSTADRGTAEHQNRQRLGQVAASEPIWADRFGDLGALSPVQMELWFWRYCSETIHQTTEGNPRCQLVKYEEFSCNSVATSRSTYRGCDRDGDDAIERAIRQSSNDFHAVATGRCKLSAEQMAQAEWVLRYSLMRDSWSGTDPVAGGLGGAGHTVPSTRL